MKYALTIVTLLLASSAAAEADTRFLPAIADSRYEFFTSEILGRGFHVYTRLPDDYEQAGDTRYPTVYLLDGGLQFPMLATYHWYLTQDDEVPEAIVVGLSYGAVDFEGGNYRSNDFTAPSEERDYYGGAADFQQFLSDELIPHVEARYRSRADRRVIFGQSLGGQFVLYTALTKPELFWGHIASNPALHRNLPFFLERYTETASASRVFVASGSRDEPRYREPALRWIEHWSNSNDKPWQLETMTLVNHTHRSAPPAAYRAGMTWLFSDVGDGETVD